MSFVKSKRKYYKYVDWTQPLLTSNTSSDLMTVSATNEGHQPAWKAFDGDDVSTAWNTYDGTTTASITANFSDKLAIFKIEVVPRYHNGSWRATSAEINGETKTFTSTETVTFNYDTPYVTNSLTITTKGNGWTGLNEVKITAKKIVESTIDDYDFYEYESLKNYILTRKKRKYYKYTYSDWTQPTAVKGGLGGSSFAVDSNHSNIATAFNSSVYLNGFNENSWFSFYNPKPLKVSGITLTSSAGKWMPREGDLYYSDDGSTWTEVKHWTSGSVTPYTISVDSTPHKYWKVIVTVRGSGSGNADLYTVRVTAQQQTVVESTIADYDFYKDRFIAYHPIVRGTRAYYKQALNERDTGTYTFTLDKEYNAKLLFVGNGGGGGSCQTSGKWFQSSGGSGACFEGRVKLSAGTYTVTLGTLGYGYNIASSSNMTGGVDSTDSYLTDSNGNELIRVGCGVRGTSWSAGGVGGTLTLGTLEVLETIKSKNGNQGNYVYKGSPSSTTGYALSAYDNTKTGYGAGTGSWYQGGNVYGVAGIFKLALETNANDYDYYEDIGTKIY